LIIPKGVITIKKKAFIGCTGLTSITIPNVKHFDYSEMNKSLAKSAYNCNIFHDYMRFCRYKGRKVNFIERRRYVEFSLLYIIYKIM